MTSPKCLHYQFSPENKLKISRECCSKLKKEPIKKWQKESNKKITITGMRKEEGGNRELISGCILTDKKGNLQKFHPLLVVDDEWENWLIKDKNFDICDLYKPPYNFKRTGCVGCPYALDLQENLETLERLLPNQRKQAEFIWQPVYDEYRRINYRLKKVEKVRLF